jgi:hypothetical protein
MLRLCSFALFGAAIFAAGELQAEIGCTTPCFSQCETCGGGKKCGCGRMHGFKLHRCGQSSGGCGSCDACDQCGGSGGLFGGHGHCGGHGHGGCHACRHHIDGLDRYFNCGCNGSYNYPVPPLYTYHWPGMFKAQRMTDYHSPWRFPPLRPYTEETLAPLIEETPAPGTMTMLAPVIHLRSAGDEDQINDRTPEAGDVVPVSQRLQRAFAR